MNLDNPELRPALVRLGFSIDAHSYGGQNRTDAAHKFADAALEVLGVLNNSSRFVMIPINEDDWERQFDY